MAPHPWVGLPHPPGRGGRVVTWALAGKTLLRNTTSNHPLCPGINTSPTVGPAVQYSTSSGVVQSGYIGYPGWAAAGLAIKFVGAAVQLLCQKPLHSFLGLPTSREWLQQFGVALFILETFYIPLCPKATVLAQTSKSKHLKGQL